MEPAMEKRKLLFLDSSETVGGTLQLLLAREYRLTQVSGAGEAWNALLASHEFSAVVLVCGWDATQALELLRRMGTNRFLSTIPAVALGPAELERQLLSMGAVAFAADATDPEMLCWRLRNLLNKVHSEADYDEMTGLYTRKMFYRATREFLDTHPDGRFVVLYVDIIHFKVINDLFGQAMGDQLICSLASEFAALGHQGTVGRLEGDRFVVCCPEDSIRPETSRDTAALLMKRYRLKYNLRICYGVYVVEDRSLSVEQMCDRAQMALNNIKDGTEEDFAYYDETLRSALLEEQEITAEMEEALEDGQFHVYLQPIYSLTTGTPVSAEALVRWQHPQKGLISPGKFIPIFERNGFVRKLDAFVWDTVFRYLSHFRAMGYPDFPISANMSRINFYDPEICCKLQGLADGYHVDPSIFRIEVTESAYVDNPSQMRDTIRQFNEAGFHVLMDDFGSGYSSLNMLMDIPVSTLKLDMGFLRDVGRSERSNSVVTSVIRMAKWLEMTVVAEGVETQEQLDFLRSIGCDRIQGYYYSKPLPIEQFNGLIAHFQRDQLQEERRRFDRIDIDAVWKSLTAQDPCTSSLLGAMGLYEVCGDSVEILAVNDEYYRIMRTTPDRLFREADNGIGWTCSESRGDLLRAFQESRRTGCRQDLVTGRFVSADRIIHIFMSVYYLGRKDDRFLYVVNGKDVTQVDGKFPVLERPAASASRTCPVRLRSDDRPKILVAEDNQVNRIMLRKILSDEYEVLEAANGQEALRQLACNLDTAAVLLDLIMPVVDGFEFLIRKQNDETLREIPVIVLSQSETRGSAIRALELGATDFVRKPYEPQKLKHRLEELIPRRTSS